MMKWPVFILCLFILTNGMEEFNCHGRPRGNYAVEKGGCSSVFVSCTDAGEAIARACVDNTFFDEEYDTCEAFEYVPDCSGQPRPNKTLDESPRLNDALPVVAFDCSGLASGNYAVQPGACENVFISCTNSSDAVPFLCPSETYYDAQLDMCLSFDQVPECSGTPKPPLELEHVAADPVERPVVPFDCSNLPNGNYPAGGCMSSFFQCSNGEALRGQCAVDTLRYSFREDACLRPANVPGCPEFDAVSPCANRPNGFYQDSDDCSKFLFCVDTIYFSLNCPEGTVYNDDRKRCMEPEKTPAPCGTAEPEEAFSCEGKQEGLYRSSADCDQYYRCGAQGKMEMFTCEAGFAFDPLKEKCEMAVKVPGCMPPMDQDLIEFCLSLNKDGIFPFPGNCHRSVVCIQNVPFVFFCSLKNRPDFDPKLLSCVPNVEGCD